MPNWDNKAKSICNHNRSKHPQNIQSLLIYLSHNQHLTMKSLTTTILLPTLLSYASTAWAAACTPSEAEDITPYLQKLGVVDKNDSGIPDGHCLTEWIEQGIDAFIECAEKDIIHAEDGLSSRPNEEVLCSIGNACVVFPSSRDTSYHCLDPEDGDFRTAGSNSTGKWVTGNWASGNFWMPDGLPGNFYTGKAESAQSGGDGDSSSDSSDSSTDTGTKGDDKKEDTSGSPRVAAGSHVIALVTAAVVATLTLA
jgi:hypothetical protein